MSTGFKIEPLESLLSNIVSHKPLQKVGSNLIDDDDSTTVFKDMQILAFTRAIKISPDVRSVTLGTNSDIISYTENNLQSPENEKTHSSHPILFSSTPKKNLPSSLPSSQISEIQNENKKELNLKDGRNSGDENSFSRERLLQECNFQRRLTVDKVMRQRIQNMYDTSKLIRESLEHLKQSRQEKAITKRMLLESKIISDIQELEIFNKSKKEAEWANNNLKAEKRIQERNQKMREAEEEFKKKSEANLLKRKQIDFIFELQKEYNQEYKNMLETIKSCKDKTSVLKLSASRSKIIKDCATISESVLKKCKEGDITEEEVKSSNKVVETIKSIHKFFKAEIEKINKIKDLEINQTQNIQEEPEEQKDESSVVKNNNSSIQSDLSDCYDAKSLETYISLKKSLENFEKTIAPLTNDDSMKKFKFNCQKAVTIPVNAISPVSASHLLDKYMKLHQLLEGKPVDVGDIKIMASEHPLGIPFCKNLLAKKFMRQGDLTVSSKPDAAFCLAAVLVSLWVDFPDFGQLVLAHFYSACPYLSPVFMPQVEGQSDKDYHKSLGYHYSQNGDVEKQDSFLKRMSGIMRLYSALIISKPRQSGKINPLGLAEGWRWLSAILNLEPRPDICATLIYDFLEVAGNEMLKVYGAQFKKVLAYICQEYFPKLEKVTPPSAGGPFVRLEGLLERIIREETIPPPQGILPPNFW